MGHTNSTANLALPQFIGTDKPTWLSDVNGAFSAIDTYAGNNDAALAITDAKADTAVNDAASAVTTATNAANTAGTASTQATNAVTVAGNALTVANGINSKVGVLTNLHTTDKSTVVNAINEVKDAEGDLSSLTTTDKTSLVAAINEAAQGGGGARTLIGSSSATGTYADKVAEIKTLFDTLTTDQKRNSFILYNSRVMPLATDQGVYSVTFTTGTGFEIDTIMLATSKVFINEAGTITDSSSASNTQVFELYA